MGTSSCSPSAAISSLNHFLIIVIITLITNNVHIIKKQDPVSTIQRTGLANYSSFLVWSVLEKGITYGCDHFWEVNNHFPVC